MKTVGIIGGAGFIGSYVTKKFLEEGYEVKVSVTNLKNSLKYQHLFKLDNIDNLTISELRVQERDPLEEFVKYCEVVVHAGTPFQLDVKDPQTELYDPTIKGTENLLKVAGRASDLKKVVFISSIGAFNTNYPFPAPGKKPGEPYNYSDGESPFISDEGHPYARAKFIANELVKSYVHDHPILPFKIVTVSPAGVMGKSLSNREDSTSMGMQYLFQNNFAPNPFLKSVYEQDAEWALVSVKDVSKAIYRVAVTPGHHGKNYLLTSECWRTSDIGRMLRGEEPLGKPTQTYSGAQASRELGIAFEPAVNPLREYGS